MHSRAEEEMRMLVERTFDAGNVSINYADGPAAGPPLLMLHGVTSRWQNFLNFMPVFTQRWHVYAADLRDMAAPAASRAATG